MSALDPFALDSSAVDRLSDRQFQQLRPMWGNLACEGILTTPEVAEVDARATLGELSREEAVAKLLNLDTGSVDPEVARLAVGALVDNRLARTSPTGAITPR